MTLRKDFSESITSTDQNHDALLKLLLLCSHTGKQDLKEPEIAGNLAQLME
jgi:hypothetical protein